MPIKGDPCTEEGCKALVTNASGKCSGHRKQTCRVCGVKFTASIKSSAMGLCAKHKHYRIQMTERNEVFV